MGLVARGITLGGSLSIDSYDTSTNTMCNPTNFGWYDLTRRSAGAFVGNPVGTFSVAGSVVVRGYASSGRGYAIPTFGGSSLCGDLAWSSGAQPGHSTNGFYTAMPDVRAPYSSGPAPASGTVNGTNYNYVLQGNKYFASN